MPFTYSSSAARSAQLAASASVGPIPSGRHTIRARTPSLCSLATISALASRPAQSPGGSITISRPLAAIALTSAGVRKPAVPPAAQARRPSQVEIASASITPAVKCNGYPGPSSPGTPNAPPAISKRKRRQLGASGSPSPVKASMPKPAIRAVRPSPAAYAKTTTPAAPHGKASAAVAPVAERNRTPGGKGFQGGHTPSPAKRARTGPVSRTELLASRQIAATERRAAPMAEE